MTMTASHLNLRCHELRCERIDCRYVFKETLRRLDAADNVECPRCATEMSIKEEKRNGDLRKAIDRARQLDANAFGEERPAAGSDHGSV